MNRHLLLQQRLTRFLNNTFRLSLLAQLNGEASCLKRLTALRVVTASDLSRTTDYPDVFIGFLSPFRQ
jgi:hypothetical protein